MAHKSKLQISTRARKNDFRYYILPYISIMYDSYYRDVHIEMAWLCWKRKISICVIPIWRE